MRKETSGYRAAMHQLFKDLNYNASWVSGRNQRTRKKEEERIYAEMDKLATEWADALK